VIACLLAAWPTRRSPLFVKATTEGVVRAPSEFSSTIGSVPSITDIQEFVVPKSIPNIFRDVFDIILIYGADFMPKYQYDIIFFLLAYYDISRNKKKRDRVKIAQLSPCVMGHYFSL
jgi:hypothetical protein